MSTGTEISALYREFTDALTEVLAENAVGPARRGRAQSRPLHTGVFCSRFEPIEDDNIDAAGYKQPSVRGFTPRPAAHSKLCLNSTSRSKKDVAAVRTDALALVETRLVGCEEHIRWYDVVDLAEPTLGD
jgi:hypothetical protein